MKITTIDKNVKVVTGKYDTIVETPFGPTVADSHEDGIEIAKEYIAARAK